MLMGLDRSISYLSESSAKSFFSMASPYVLESFLRLFFKLPLYTLAGFDLTTHSSSFLGGRRRRYH
jgi:hypothetical protein